MQWCFSHHVHCDLTNCGFAMLLFEVLDPALFFRDEVCQDIFQILHKIKGKKVGFQLVDQAQTDLTTSAFWGLKKISPRHVIHVTQPSHHKQGCDRISVVQLNSKAWSWLWSLIQDIWSDADTYRGCADISGSHNDTCCILDEKEKQQLWWQMQCRGSWSS